MIDLTRKVDTEKTGGPELFFLWRECLYKIINLLGELKDRADLIIEKLSLLVKLVHRLVTLLDDKNGSGHAELKTPKEARRDQLATKFHLN